MSRERMAEKAEHARAQSLWELGTKRLTEGRILEALRLYEESIALRPTAEGYTYRGWAVSSLGDLDEAMEDCRKAICLDPDFGNPYNDIGAYLIQQGRHNDAIPWLESAKRAKRYATRHFAYLNLGRVYLARGEKMRALDELAKALELSPGEPSILKELQRIDYSVH